MQALPQHDLTAQQTRGLRAAELLQHEVLAEALAAIDAEIIEQWADCPARDKEGKEALWQLKKTSDKFRALLLGYIKSGKLATEQLKRYEKESRMRGLLRRI